MKKVEIDGIPFGTHACHTFVTADDVEMECPFASQVDFAELTSWDEIELLCASNGTEVTKPIFNFFVVGIMLLENIANLMIEAFKERTWMTKQFKTVDDASLLYIISRGTTTTLECTLKERQIDLIDKWLKCANKFEDTDGWASDGKWPRFYPNGHISRFHPLGLNITNELTTSRIALFNAVDLTNPFLLLKFYSQFHRTKFLDDTLFIKYLLQRTKLKAKYNNYFEDIYKKLEGELTNLQYYSMHMS